MKTVSIAMCVAAYLLSAVILALYPQKKRNLLKSAGEPVFAITRNASPLFFLVIAVAFLVITLVLLRSFGVMIDAIFCACAVLSLELISRDRIASVLAGVYKNALIVDGKCILFSEILSLPTLAYEEDSDVCTLKIVTKKEGAFFISFENSEERRSVVEKILECAPFLKPEK